MLDTRRSCQGLGNYANQRSGLRNNDGVFVRLFVPCGSQSEGSLLTNGVCSERDSSPLQASGSAEVANAGSQLTCLQNYLISYK